MRHRIRERRGSARACSSPRRRKRRRDRAKLADRFHFVITPYYAALMDPGRSGLCPIRRQVVPARCSEDATRFRAGRSPGRGGPLAGQERDPRLPGPHRLLREQRVRALLPLLPAQAHGGEPDDWAMKRRELLRGPRLDPRHARDPRRPAHRRRPARLLGRAPRVAAGVRAARDPPRGDDPARHPAAGDAALPRHRGPLPHARALPPDLGEHPLQPPARAHARGAAEACDRLTRAGIPVGNQSVLLRGINDDP